MSVHLYALDGIAGGLFINLFGDDDTVYAEQYEDAAYRQIRRGDTTAAVLAALGEPLETFGMTKDRRADDGWLYRRTDADAEGWSYTMSPRSSHYRKRIIVFRDGYVIDKVNKIYID